MTAQITFYGGAGTVTGANFLLDCGEKKILVDCGALEREHVCEPENLKQFAYDPREIDVLFVTHAHQDHIGRVPKLVREGFKGTILSTPATRDLSVVMFEDALSIMQNDRERHGCTPMYEKSDVEHALSLWHTREYHQQFNIPEVSPLGSGDTSGITAEFLDAGHILGSAMVKLSRSDRTIVFTGDIGNSPEPLLRDAEIPLGANYLVMESVYGYRVHEGRSARRDLLKEVVLDTVRKRGTLLVPSFSIERTQILLFELNDMIEKKEIPAIPVYLDAPLAIRVTQVFERYRNLLKEDAQKAFAGGRDPFAFEGLVQTPSVRDSQTIYDQSDPKIIIAGSGMSSGGRVRAHEKRYLPDEKATVLLVGYQAPNSLGRRIADGQKRIEIDREEIPVHAQVEMLSGYSGHADRDQLMQLVEDSREKLEQVFVVMGEPKASLYLAQRLRDFLDIKATAPGAGESAAIDW